MMEKKIIIPATTSWSVKEILACLTKKIEKSGFESGIGRREGRVEVTIKVRRI